MKVQAIAAVGHIPFPGHRTCAGVREFEERADNDLDLAKEIVRKDFGYVTPFRIGLVAGKHGLTIPIAAQSPKWRRLYWEGRKFSKQGGIHV